MKPSEEIPRYAALAAQTLKTDEAPAVPGSLGDRAGDLAVIERALRARSRRRWRPWAALGATVAAAGIAFFVLTSGGSTGKEAIPAGPTLGSTSPRLPPLAVAGIQGAELSLEIAGDERPAVVGEELPVGARLAVPPSGEATLVLASGTRLELGGGSSTRVAELGRVQRFELLAGTLRASVAKLGPGRRFVIGTPDAEVEVKGTRFNVTIDPETCGSGPKARTRVSVKEGVVVVRHGDSEVRLGAGSEWPTCSNATAPAPAVRHPPRASLERAHAAPAAESVPIATPPSADVEGSTLAEQNDLFSAALAAARRGELDEALHWIDRLLVRYPGGPLAEAARSERARLLVGRKTGPE